MITLFLFIVTLSSEAVAKWLPTLLPWMKDGAVIKCTDCVVSNPCVGGGQGAYAVKIRGKFVCLSKVPKEKK